MRLMTMSKVRKAVIPAAGYGTRFLPISKAVPKEMLPLVDKPVIQYIVEEAVASGIEEIVFVTAVGKRAIEDHFDRVVELESELEAKGKKESKVKLVHKDKPVILEAKGNKVSYKLTTGSSEGLCKLFVDLGRVTGAFCTDGTNSALQACSTGCKETTGSGSCTRQDQAR